MSTTKNLVRIIKKKVSEPIIEPPKDNRQKSPPEDENTNPSLGRRSLGEETSPGSDRFFQAIGTITGKIGKNSEGKFCIYLKDKSYPLFIPKPRYTNWIQQMNNHPDRDLFLRVYPKYQIIPKKEPVINFIVIAWSEQNCWEEEAGIFYLKGVWQFVPQVRGPVLSIYRNHQAFDPQQKYKATHLPVSMRREDGSSPFRFNPKAKEQGKRWFIQGKFRFLTSRNCWGWLEDLSPSTETIPHYRKPVAVGPRAADRRKGMPTKRKAAAIGENQEPGK